MKFGQLIEIEIFRNRNNRNIFLHKSSRKSGRETSSRPLYIFLKKVLYDLKASALQLSFNVF